MDAKKFLMYGSLSFAMLLLSLTVVSVATIHLANAQSVSTPSGIVDTSPNAAIIIINRDASSGNIFFHPNNVTIKVGEEILILNNSTSPQSFTSGKSAGDPASGTMFDTGLIPPKQFTEYTAANLREGQYPFHSTAAPSATGTLTVVAAKK